MRIIEFLIDYDKPNKQYGCYFQQQFRKPINKSDLNSSAIRAGTRDREAYSNGINRSIIFIY